MTCGVVLTAVDSVARLLRAATDERGRRDKGLMLSSMSVSLL